MDAMHLRYDDIMYREPIKAEKVPATDESIERHNFIFAEMIKKSAKSNYRGEC